MDDNEELRYFIVSILRKEYHIIEAENGKKGLEIIRLELPDLVLSDVMMPCMDGIELLEEVKKNHDTSHIPFVLLSAKSALYLEAYNNQKQSEISKHKYLIINTF